MKGRLCRRPFCWGAPVSRKQHLASLAAISHFQMMKQSNTQRPKREAPVIDQDGRVLRPDELDGNGFRRAGQNGAAFEFQTFGFGTPLTREQRVARLDALATLLDMAFIIPGTKMRYGIDGMIGLIPIVGDIITTAISLWIVREARALGAPRYLVARMLANVAIDGAVGAVPLIGDAFDVAFKANVRNMRMLRRWMDKQNR